MNGRVEGIYVNMLDNQLLLVTCLRYSTLVKKQWKQKTEKEPESKIKKKGTIMTPDNVNDVIPMSKWCPNDAQKNYGI